MPPPGLAPPVLSAPDAAYTGAGVATTDAAADLPFALRPTAGSPLPRPKPAAKKMQGRRPRRRHHRLAPTVLLRMDPFLLLLLPLQAASSEPCIWQCCRHHHGVRPLPVRRNACKGYVERDDVLIESLTVREMLYYWALLQIPGVFSSKKPTVDDAIAAMSLGDYADKLIGGHCFAKRLPTGERRRVSIARELVMRPHVLFIDEPLYHLDSVSALLLMVTLKKLASTGCTVIFTMYQSSTEVFGLFDRICFLSNGNTLFFGETRACLQHFSNAGFPCPIMQSPTDHFLRAINTDFDRIIRMAAGACEGLFVMPDTKVN